MSAESHCRPDPSRAASLAAASPLPPTGIAAPAVGVPAAPRCAGLLPQRTAALPPDVLLLAWAALGGGLLALAGALVAPGVAAQPALQVRVVGIGLMLVLVACGLLARRRWARSAAAGMLVYGFVAQLTQGWVQDDVVAAFLEALTGRHPLQGAGALLATADDAGGAPSLWTVLGCLMTGWYALRLAAASLLAEVRASRRRGSTSVHRPL